MRVDVWAKLEWLMRLDILFPPEPDRRKPATVFNLEVATDSFSLPLQAASPKSCDAVKIAAQLVKPSLPIRCRNMVPLGASAWVRWYNSYPQTVAFIWWAS